jgi:hypothetical protein
VVMRKSHLRGRGWDRGDRARGEMGATHLWLMPVILAT